LVASNKHAQESLGGESLDIRGRIICGRINSSIPPKIAAARKDRLLKAIESFVHIAAVLAAGKMPAPMKLGALWKLLLLLDLLG